MESTSDIEADPVAKNLVDQQHLLIRSRRGHFKICRLREALRNQAVVNHPVFSKREDMVAQVQVVPGMVDQFIGQHPPIRER